MTLIWTLPSGLTTDGGWLLQQFVKTFVPLFIVIDAFGNMPFVIALSERMSRREMVLVAVATASFGLVFRFVEKSTLHGMGDV